MGNKDFTSEIEQLQQAQLEILSFVKKMLENYKQAVSDLKILTDQLQAIEKSINFITNQQTLLTQRLAKLEGQSPSTGTQHASLPAESGIIEQDG